MSPMTFARGYWAVVVSKLCYGMFLVNLKKRSIDKLDKVHVDVAKNIQGLAPNTPAIVALGSIKLWRILTHIAVEAMMFAWQLLSLPMENVYKKIFVQRLVELRSVNYNQIQTGPVAGIVKICMDYGIIEYINQSLKSGVVVSKSEWKKNGKGMC